MKKEFGEYYLGLDVGTDSVGWAVTNLDYNLVKFNGKSLWGVRLFESGKTAEERRLYRSARRRQQRRVQRIKLLQELFSEEICKVDSGFYQRLEESMLYQEDKSINQTNTLFNDENFKDKDYHKLYPTIYHLRKSLIDGKSSYDVRLVYLAVHHIIKNRGHFLFEGQTMKNISSFKEVFNELNLYLYDEFDMELYCPSLDEVEEVLKNRQLGVKNKKKKLIELLNADSKQKEAIANLLSGAVTNISDLYNDKSFNDQEINKISFSDGKYEEIQDQLSDVLEEKLYFIEKLKAIYDWAILAEIRQSQPYLSYAKVKVYEKHQYDLKILKKVVKNYIPDKYKEIFLDNKNDKNYCAYVGICKKSNKKMEVAKKCTQEDLCKYLEKILKGIKTEDVDYKYIMREVENRNFLPKQINRDNGVIPYQMNLEELEIILENASKYLCFLNNVDETGLSNKEKIKEILKFRIPYYVGPLNDAHKENGNCWIVKRSNDKIRPWNFNEVVNLEESAEKFIERMTNKCTYLIGADVLPKNSLLYSEFTVLNELNNLKINNENISVEIKNKIYIELFMTHKRVTNKLLKSFLLSEGIIEIQDEVSGIDGDFKSSLASYIDFKRIIADKVKKVEMVESIIRWIVLFGDDKKLLKTRINKLYGKELSEEEIKKILTLKYKGWGRLSKEFLNDIMHVDKSTGEYISIISNMRKTNNNLMKLLSSNYDYLKAIDNYNSQFYNQTTEINYDIVEKLYTSPSVKRSIWQTLTIVREIAKIMGKSPKKIFVEMARADGEKKPTKSRRNMLLDLYNTCKLEEKNLIEGLSSQSDNDLRNDRLYLYYTQLGRCMYSGEPIEISKLFDKNIYDVDHIYPRSKVKDDSIGNRVLVKKVINAQKSDYYPLPREIQNKNKGFWKSLYNKKLIDIKKYERLIRTTEFSDDELAGFISRQIVETRQSTKAVAEVLKKVFSSAEIVYVKAGNVSEFRDLFDLNKVRDINDFHHARDAYLNIVVGNVFNTKFTHNPLNFIKDKTNKYSLNRMYDFDIFGKDMTAWKSGEKGTIGTVKDVMRKNNILFTRYAYEQKGSLFKQTINKKGNPDLFPIKSSIKPLQDTKKYGGYNSINTAYFILVEHTRKDIRVKSIEYIPIYLVNRINQCNETLIEYCIKDLNLIDPIILLSKIKIDTLFNIDGFFMHLSGRTGSQLIFKGANQLCINYKEELYIKKILKVNGKLKDLKGKYLITSHDGISKYENIQIYDLLLNKLKNTIYNKRLSAQVNTFEQGRNRFLDLCEEEQCILLGEFLNLFKCNSVTSNLSLIGGGKESGKILLSNTISKYQSVMIINQSPTGLFSKDVDVLNYELENCCNIETSEA